MQRLAVPTIVLTTLFVLVQSAEFVGAEGVAGARDEPLLGEAAGQKPLVDMDPTPPPPPPATDAAELSAAHQALIADVEKVDPSVSLTPAKFEDQDSSLAPDQAQAQLHAQLSSMTDEDGKPALTGIIHDPANTTISANNNVGSYPAGDDDAANAIMAGQKPGSGGAASISSTPQFRKIPFFKFAHKGTPVNGYTEKQCEAACASDAECMSYSYNTMDQECIKSKGCVQYDLQFDFFAKKADKEEGSVGFRHLGALKYMYSGKGSSDVKAHLGKNKLGCEALCKEEEACKSFCVNTAKLLCLTSTQDLGYEQGWNYFEKQGAAARMAEMQKYGTPVKGSVDDMAAQMGGKKAGVKATTMNEAAKADEDPSLSAQIVRKENAALSSGQLQYLADNEKKDGSAGTRLAVMNQALAQRNGEMTAAQKARIALARKVAEQAQKKAESNLSQEAKGKRMYESEMRSTDGALRYKLESVGKTAWKSQEKEAKSAEEKREATQKEAQATKAEKARDATAKQLTEVSQKALEARDHVQGVEVRKQMYKEHLKALQTSDKNVVHLIEQLKADEAKAASMIAESANTKKLNQDKDVVQQQMIVMDDAQTLQATTAETLQKNDEEVPTLMAAKAQAANDLASAKSELATADLALKAAATQAQAVTMQVEVTNAKEKVASAESALTTTDTKLTKLKDAVASDQRSISESKDKESQASALKHKKDFEIKFEEARLGKLKSDGDVLLGSSKFKKGQELGNEVLLKHDLANAMKKELEFEESDVKKKLKLKELQAQVKELESARKEQNVEQKVKIAVSASEKAAKLESIADNKLKAAKSDGERAAKMLTAAKLQGATAISPEQKAEAAKQESSAEMLKVSGEQQIVAAAPDLQRAKQAQEVAADKLEALKELFKDDEAGYKKAMGMFGAATAAFNKAKQQGPLDNINAETAYDKGLKDETAMLEGMGALTKGYSSDGTASERASNAVNGLSEVEIKAGKKSAVIQQVGKGGALSVQEHMAHERNLKHQISQASEKETGIKSQIATETGTEEQFQKNQLQREKDQTVENDAKEQRRKVTGKQEQQAAAGNEVSEKKHEVQMATLKESTAKATTKAASKKAEVAKVITAANKKGYGCDVDANGKPMKLDAQERCSKDKSASLSDEERQAKSDAKQREQDIKLKEANEKDKEKKAKEESKVKSDKKEKDSKESNEKEKTRKENMSEQEKKESETKHNEQEKATKENEMKATERKETATKESQKKTSEQNEKKTKTEEEKTKSKEKTSKDQEKATKEKTKKDGMTEKQKKEAQVKIKEQTEKTTESDTKEAKTKGEDEKGTKETETKEQEQKTQEKGTKEKEEKAEAESETRTKEHAQKGIAGEKEKETKESENKTNESATKEKAEKERQTEETNKATVKKQQAQQTQAKESKAKTDANESATKANAQNANANAAASAISTGGVRL